MVALVKLPWVCYFPIQNWGTQCYEYSMERCVEASKSSLCVQQGENPKSYRGSRLSSKEGDHGPFLPSATNSLLRCWFWLPYQCSLTCSSTVSPTCSSPRMALSWMVKPEVTTQLNRHHLSASPQRDVQTGPGENPTLLLGRNLWFWDLGQFVRAYPILSIITGYSKQ